jgi:hypothetical protein
MMQGIITTVIILSLKHEPNCVHRGRSIRYIRYSDLAYAFVIVAGVTLGVAPGTVGTAGSFPA